MLHRKLLVIGGGNAAGVDHFCVSRYGQQTSFVGRLAASGELACSLPIVSPPGIACIPGFVIIPPPKRAASYFENYYPGQVWGNFSAPFARAADFLAVPDSQSLTSDTYQPTGLLDRMLCAVAGFNSSEPRLRQYLRAYAPTDVIVELGMHDSFDLLVEDNQEDLPAIAARLVEQLLEICSAVAECGLHPVVFTVPSPVSLPYFQRAADLSRLRTIAGHNFANLQSLSPGDLVPLPLAYRWAGGSGQHTCVLAGHDLVPIREARAAAVTRAVELANVELCSRLPAHGASIFDYSGLLAELGTRARNDETYFLGSRHFGLSGLFLSPQGQKYLTQRLCSELGYGAYESKEEPAADFGITITASDKSDLAGYRLREGSRQFEAPIQSLYPALDPFDRQEACTPLAGIPAGGTPELSDGGPELVLPPGRVQVVHVNQQQSAVGDILSAVDSDEASHTIGVPAVGFERPPLFLGDLITATTISGAIEVRFSEPQSTAWSVRTVRFQIRHIGGLAGEGGAISAPVMYALPYQEGILLDANDVAISSGELCLATGRVRNFHYNVYLFNDAIGALLEANPQLRLPALLFPGLPGTGHATITFTQRDSESLDMEIRAAQFLPLGKAIAGQTVRLPLPFRDKIGRLLSVPARGTSLNPWVYLTTKQGIDEVSSDTDGGQFPENTVRHYLLDPARSNFGDDFVLPIPELGGTGYGKTPVSGALAVQFGRANGNLVPIVLQLLAPTGVPEEDAPVMPYLPHGTRCGVIGFDRKLRFPCATFTQEALAFLTDPFKKTIALVDRRTLAVTLVGLRAYISQDMFLNLLRVEPAIPRDSFIFTGQGRFRSANARHLDLHATVEVPFPAGQSFPSPAGGSAAFTLGRDGHLRPFVNLSGVAIGPPRATSLCKKGLVADDGTIFGVTVETDSDGQLAYASVTAGESTYEMVECFEVLFGHPEPPSRTLCSVACRMHSVKDRRSSNAAIDFSMDAVGYGSIAILLDGGLTESLFVEISR